MSDHKQPEQNQDLSGAPSPEELEAAQAANEADALSAAQAELAVLQAKNTELADNFLRAKAEAENARRRADDEIAKARKFAVESFAESLLPVTDSLEAGLQQPDATADQIREGTEATLKQLKSALERNKVIEINPATGTKFDPHQHQAAIPCLEKGFAAPSCPLVLQNNRLRPCPTTNNPNKIKT